MDLLKVPELQPGRRAETLRMAADAGLEIMMLMKDYLPDPSVGFPQYVRQIRHNLARLD